MSCKEKENGFAEISVNSKYGFGEIKSTDSVVHTFKVKNISKVDLLIKEVGTSCGCTVVTISDSIVKENEYTEIKTTFVPDSNTKGKVNKSIVILANTNPPYTSLEVFGYVK
jgi:hypothetical protein